MLRTPAGYGNSEDFFCRLDTYLKANKRRLAEVFEIFDTDHNRALDRRELGNLVRAILPEATDGEVRYFQVSIGGRGGAF